jgi:osmotically-inducible protein OsmY
MMLQAAEPPVNTVVTGSRLPNSAIGDRELQRRVRSFLSNRLPQSSRLRIEADNGVVTLQGTHTSFYHKQLCINCCQRVAGVVQLIDMSKVVSPG